MLESPRGLRVLVLAAIVLCIVASLTGAHAGQEKGGLKFAVVDMQRLNDEYTAIKNFREAADKQDRDFKVEFEVVQRNQLLNEADRKALVALRVKERNDPKSLTKPEQDKLKQLDDASQALNADFVKLQMTAVGALTVMDQKKLQDYTALQNSASDYIKTRRETLTNQLDSQAKELQGVVMENMQKAMNDVAKKSGYSLVLSKQYAPYAEYDCTKDVLAQLNKK